MKLCPFLTEIRKKIKNFEPLRGVNCSPQRRIAAQKTFRIKGEIVGFAKKKAVTHQISRRQLLRNNRLPLGQGLV